MKNNWQRKLKSLAGTIFMITLLGACGGGAGGDTAGTEPPTTTETPAADEPIVAGANLVTYLPPTLIAGQKVSLKLAALPADDRNKVTGFVVTNTTTGGSAPLVSSDGVLEWTPNLADKATPYLSVKILTEKTGDAAAQLPARVMSPETVFEAPLQPGVEYYSDPEGQYVLKVTGGEGPLQGTLKLEKFQANDGSFFYMPKLTGSTAVAELIESPRVLTNTAITPQSMMMRSGARLAPQRGLNVLSGVGGNEFDRYGVEAVGSLLLDVRDNYSAYLATLRNDINPDTRGTAVGRDFRLIQIDSSCNISSSSLDHKCDGQYAPIIFIHGYAPEVGGGSSTWADSAQMALNAGHDVFEFRWSTLMRFEEAAAQLTHLIQAVAWATNKRPIIIGHSFGGVVGHLALSEQGIEWKNSDWHHVKFLGGVGASGYVERFITLGAPLGGMYTGSFGGDAVLPGMEWGRDSSDYGISWCAAVTCAQAGGNESNGGKTLAQRFDMMSGLLIKGSANKVEPPVRSSISVGESIRRISSITTGVSETDGIVPKKHSIPTTTLVGFKGSPAYETRDSYDVKNTDLGDGLFSIKGQMFIEDLKKAGSDFSILSTDVSWPNLVEKNYLVRAKSYANANVDYLYFKSIKHSAAQGLAEFGSEAGAEDRVYKYGNGKMILGDYTEQNCLDAAGTVEPVPLTFSNVNHCVYYARHPLASIISQLKYSSPVDMPLGVAKFWMMSGSVSSNAIQVAAANDAIFPFVLEMFDSQSGTRVGRGSFHYGVTNSAGEYSVDLSGILDQRAEGFNRSNIYAVLTFGDNVVYEQTKVAVQNLASDQITVPDVVLKKIATRPGMVNVSGKVIDAQTAGLPIEGARVKLRMGKNLSTYDLFWATNSNTSRSVTTDSAGNFYVNQIRPGVYSALVQKPGYVQDIQGQVTVTADGQLSLSLLKQLTANESAVTLRWDSGAGGAGVSHDLDSHLISFNQSGGLRYHIYYESPVFGGDSLDRDDTDYEGPETITFANDPSASYVYYVHNYSGGGSTIPKSNPLVILRAGNSVYRFDLPVDQALSSRYWRVFDMVGGRVIPCRTGCLQDAPPSGISAQAQFNPLSSDVASYLRNLPNKK